MANVKVEFNCTEAFKKKLKAAAKKAKSDSLADWIRKVLSANLK